MKLIVAFTIIAVVSINASPLGDFNQHWESFKVNHGKSYETKAQELLRKQIFKINFERVNEHNALYEQGLVSYTLEVNKFADLTQKEFTETYNGFKGAKNFKNSNIKLVDFVVPKDSEVPDEVDWRKQGAVTPVKDQGACGSCWAFSSTGALEGQYFLRNGNLISISEQNLVDCSTNGGNLGCGGGLMIPAYEYVQINDGIDLERTYPYEAIDNKCRYDPKGNSTTIQSITVVEKANEEALKQAIANVGPVAVAIDASNADFHLYGGGVYYEEVCLQGLDDLDELDHAVLAVGYGSENGVDYWLIKNSWASDWGQDGYIKMARNRDNNCGIASYAIIPNVW